MKKKITLSLLILFSCYPVFSQAIELRLQTLYGAEPISGTLNFVIDKLDSTVLGFGVSDEKGYSTTFLTKEPKSPIVTVKIFGMGYGEVDVPNVRWNSDRTTIIKLELDPGREDTKLFTVAVNGSGSEMEKVDPLLYDIPMSYYQNYLDTAQYYYDQGVEEEKKYKLEDLQYKKDLRELDSMHTLNPQEAYGIVGPPLIPEPYITPTYLDSSKSMNKDIRIDGGWNLFCAHFTGNNQFRSLLRKNGKLRVWLSPETGYEPVVDTVVVTIPDKGVVKGLKTICFKIMQKQLKLRPVMLGGNQVKLEDKMHFYIEFIYKED